MNEPALPEELSGQSGRYRVERELARGGFGVTWLAHRIGDGAPVVIKRLRLERTESWKAVELFQREARVLRGLVHPRIPAWVDDFALGDAQAPDAFVLVQAFVPGPTLRDVQRSARREDMAAMVRWLLETLEILVYLHGLDPPVIHRDISPKNVILNEATGEATLIDFGTVQAALRSASTISSTSAGTFGYAPMEQFIGRATPSSDLYGLAMTFVAVVTGREPEELPFRGNELDVRAALAGTRVDARLLVVLEQLLRANPEARLQDAASALERLAPLRGGVASATPQASPAPRPVGSGPAEEAQRRWRDAAARIARISPLGAAQADPRGLDGVAISPDGRLLVLQSSEVLHTIDLVSGAIRRLPYGDYQSGPLAFSADGQSLFLIGTDKSGDYCVFRIDGLGGEVSRRALAQPAVGDYSSEAFLAASPDGTMLAIGEEEVGSGVTLVDAQTGALIHQFKGHVRHGMTFSPDGHYLIWWGGEVCGVFDREGGGHTERAALLAVSPDGALAARVTLKDDEAFELQVGALKGLAPLSMETRPWKARVRTQEKERRYLRFVRFSPDGARLLVRFERYAKERWAHDIELVDASTGVRLHALQTALQTEEGFYPYRFDDMLFGLGGRLAVIKTPLLRAPGGEDYDQGVLLYDLERGAPRLALLGGDEGLVALFPEGAQVLLPTGRRGKKKGREADAPSALEQAARDRLVGRASATPDEAVEDLLARYDFFIEKIAAREITGKVDLHKLVEATAGLTHLLPRVLELAREQRSERPRFGQAGGGGGLNGDAIRRAAASLRAASEAERQVHFEDMLAAVEAEALAKVEAELEEARREAKREAAPSPEPRARASASAPAKDAAPTPGRARPPWLVPLALAAALVAAFVVVVLVWLVLKT